MCCGGECVQAGTVPGKHGREEMQMKKIIFDCDNTFGVKDCDVDDGLALMYLLGSREAQLLGITSTYGNSSLDVVQAVNLRMLEELGRRDIPVKRGGEKRGCYQSEAAVFLAEMADRHPGELSILATGSLTNLKGAYERDSHFFEKVKEIVLMGGITSPLVFEKKVMEELNFSCDPPAARTVLTKGRNVSVITGNNCLEVLFTKQEYRERLSGTVYCDYCPNGTSQHEYHLYGKEAITMFFQNKFLFRQYSILSPVILNERQAEFIASFGGCYVMAIANLQQLSADGYIRRLTVRPR